MYGYNSNGVALINLEAQDPQTGKLSMMIVSEILIIIIYNNRFREILNNSERKYGIRDSKCVV